jgi:hypothetical protein
MNQMRCGLLVFWRSISVGLADLGLSSRQHGAVVFCTRKTNDWMILVHFFLKSRIFNMALSVLKIR